MKYGKQISVFLGIDTPYREYEKTLINDFMSGITYKMSLYLSYFSENGIYFEDKKGSLFYISYELSRFDEIYDKNEIICKTRFMDLIGPAIELWIQNM